MTEPDSLTLARLLQRAASEWPSRTAVREGTFSMSFAEADSAANQVGNWLLAQGIGHGDVVGYLGKNSTDFLLGLWGAAKIGAVFTPYNWRLTPTELVTVLRTIPPALCFTDSEQIDTARTSKVPNIIPVGPNDDGPTLLQTTSQAANTAPPATVDQSDVALVLLTSGTTGVPKGAMLTGESLLRVRTSQPADEVWASWSDDGEVIVLAMPLFHIGGIALSLSAVAYGAQMVVLRDFNPSLLINTISTHRVTRLFMVPAALRQLLDQARSTPHDFSSVRCISYGASPISADLLDECRRVIGGELAQNYGVTESSGTVVVLPPQDHATANARLASAGRPLHGVEAQVIGPTGGALPSGDVGEVVLRSTSNMKGYWNDPEATRQVLDDDGWLRTGDAGYLDDDGYIYLRARIKDVVISGGENIYPTEIEAALLEHPDVLEAAAFGVPHERWGETVRAEIVLSPGATVTEADLDSWLRERLAAYKVPRTFGFRQALPRNASGKVLYRTLRAPFWDNHDREIS